MKLRSRGRGRGYSLWRGVMESALELLYRGDWPAHLWGALPGSARVTVVRHTLRLSSRTGKPCRIAFVSDLHVGPTTPLSLLKEAFAVLRREEPDVLLLGGDYVYLEAEPSRLATLQHLVSSVPCSVKLGVLGNHDLWTSDDDIVRALAGVGVRVLVNEVAPLPEPWSDVAIIGLDDPWAGTCDTSAAASHLDSQPARVVVCHSPDGLASLAAMRFDAFVAGHTHGGQIAAPWGPIVLPHGRLCRRYPSGTVQVGSGVVHVSRGVGTVDLPVRAFAGPEVMLMDLL